MRVKILVVIFLILLPLLPLTLFSYQNQIRIAVIDLKPIGIHRNNAMIVSDLLRTELFKTKLFTVLERDQMNKILKEQDFQVSGCTDTECGIEIGKLLNANKVLLGTVGKLDDKYIINARIVDVKKGITEFAETTKVDSKADLDKGCEIFAKKIAAMIKSSGKFKPIEIKTDEKFSGDEVKDKKAYTYPFRTWSYIAGGVSILSFAGGLYYNSLINFYNDDANKEYNKYQNAKGETSDYWYSEFSIYWDSYKSYVEDSKDAQKKRNIFYIISAATGTTGIVFFLIKKPINERLSIKFNNQCIQLAYKF